MRQFQIANKLTHIQIPKDHL